MIHLSSACPEHTSAWLGVSLFFFGGGRFDLIGLQGFIDGDIDSKLVKSLDIVFKIILGLLETSHTCFISVFFRLLPIIVFNVRFSLNLMIIHLTSGFDSLISLCLILLCERKPFFFFSSLN